MKKPLWNIALSMVLILALAVPAMAVKTNFPEVVFILDASGSMWGQAAGKHKIQIAKEVMTQIVPALPKEVRVGLVAYGHRRKGDCQDVETLVQPGSQDRTGLLAKVQALSPKGKTPIASSVRQTAEALKTKENETTIVLVSDGMETCNDDPCAVIKSLKQSGIKFVLHVVGFDVNQQGKKQLECLAGAGGGKFFAASDAGSLLAAFETVKKEVVQKVAKAKTKKTKAKSRLGKLSISLPEGSARTLAGVRIVRAKDNKTVKEAEKAAGTHPLLAGKYQVYLLYANTNYRKPDVVDIGVYEVAGGETAKIELGALAVNIAKPLGDTVSGLDLVNLDSGKPYLRHLPGDNNYYLFRTRPLPAGRYSLGFVLGRNKEPHIMAPEINIIAGKTTTFTLDSGIQLKKASGSDVRAWKLTKAGTDEEAISVARRFDNDWPIWRAIPVPPGSYDLWVTVKGMAEPLPVGEGVEVIKGQTLEFDTGL